MKLVAILVSTLDSWYLGKLGVMITMGMFGLGPQLATAKVRQPQGKIGVWLLTS